VQKGEFILGIVKYIAQIASSNFWQKEVRLQHRPYVKKYFTVYFEVINLNAKYLREFPDINKNKKNKSLRISSRCDLVV